MGILPLCFQEGDDADSLGLDGTEYFSITLDKNIVPLQIVEVTAKKENGDVINFKVQVRLDTPVEVEYYINGGILHTVVRNLAK
jgi:aconitate hydratase